jgi:iron complex outermembrane receptor protein
VGSTAFTAGALAGSQYAADVRREIRFIAGISSGALGQANPGSGSDSALEEVIVTAQKREESIRDVPASIAVFSGTRLKEANINSAMDLQMATPSLSISHIDAQQFIFLRSNSRRGR